MPKLPKSTFINPLFFLFFTLLKLKFGILSILFISNKPLKLTICKALILNQISFLPTTFLPFLTFQEPSASSYLIHWTQIPSTLTPKQAQIIFHLHWLQVLILPSILIPSLHSSLDSSSDLFFFFLLTPPKCSIITHYCSDSLHTRSPA